METLKTSVRITVANATLLTYLYFDNKEFLDSIPDGLVCSETLIGIDSPILRNMSKKYVLAALCSAYINAACWTDDEPYVVELEFRDKFGAYMMDNNVTANELNADRFDQRIKYIRIAVGVISRLIFSGDIGRWSDAVHIFKQLERDKQDGDLYDWAYW